MGEGEEVAVEEVVVNFYVVNRMFAYFTIGLILLAIIYYQKKYEGFTPGASIKQYIVSPIVDTTQGYVLCPNGEKSFGYVCCPDGTPSMGLPCEPTYRK